MYDFEIIKKTFSAVLRDYLTLAEYEKMLGARPNLSDVLPAYSKECLFVGGSEINPKWREIGAPWSTLDPYCPNAVTFRTGLEDRVWSDSCKDRFELVVINAVFEHINPYIIKDCVESVTEVTKHGGRLYIEIPYVWQYHPADKRYDFGGDYGRYTPQGIVSMFTITGKWECSYCNLVIPAEAPDGIGIVCVLRKIEQEVGVAD